MPVTESLMSMGSWSLTLRPDTPAAVRNAVKTPYQHVLITPSWVDCNAMTDAEMLDVAIYTGVVLRPGPSLELGGVGLLWWLGDERGVPHMAVPLTSTGASLSSWVTSLLNLTSITVGSVTGAGPVGGTVAAAFQYQSTRTAIEALFKYFQVEFRINPDYTFDYGAIADLYGSAAVATALPKGQGGREQGLKGFQVSELDYSRDFTDLLTHVTAAGRGGTGTASGLTILTDFDAAAPDGNNIIRRAFFDAPEAASGFEANYAQSIIDRYSDVDFVGVSTDDFVRGTFGPGYYLNVYDYDRGLLDETNQTVFQGDVIFPKLVRIIDMQWPIQDGCGVYYRWRESGIVGSATYTDLTPYVQWDRPGTKIGTGNPAYSPINDQFSVSAQSAPVLASGWDTYTPAVVQSGSVTVTVNRAVWRPEGTKVTVELFLTVTGSGTGGNQVTVSLPRTAAYATKTLAVGAGYIYDQSAATIYNGTVIMVSTTTVGLMLAAGRAGAATFAAGLASPDEITFAFTYEAAA